MPFANPIIGGEDILIRPAIKSPNYVPGVDGWEINRDGSAEFQDVTVRGTVILAPGQVTDVELADGAVVENKIAVNAVTNAKIAGAAVDGTKLADGSVSALKIIDGAVVESKLGPDSVTQAKIAAAAVGTTEIAASAVVADSIAANAVVADKIAANAVVAGKIAANAVGANEIAANAVVAGKIAAGAIDTMTLNANTITGATISGSTVTADSGHIVLDSTGLHVNGEDGGEIHLYNDVPGNHASIDFRPPGLNIEQGQIIATTTDLGGGSAYATLGLYGPTVVGSTDQAYAVAKSPNTNLGSGSELLFEAYQKIEQYLGSPGSYEAWLKLLRTYAMFHHSTKINVDSPIVNSGPIYALADPGSGSVTAEAWTSITPLNTWTNRGGDYPLFGVRLVASPPKSVQIVGNLWPGTVAAGIAIGQVDAKYRPVKIQSIPVSGAGSSATATPQIEVGIDGYIRLWNFAGGMYICINNVYPLDR